MFDPFSERRRKPKNIGSVRVGIKKLWTHVLFISDWCVNIGHARLSNPYELDGFSIRVYITL